MIKIELKIKFLLAFVLLVFEHVCYAMYMRWQCTCAARFQPRLKKQNKRTLIRGHSRQGSACGVDMLDDHTEAPAAPRFCLAVSKDFQQSVSCRKVFWGK